MQRDEIASNGQCDSECGYWEEDNEDRYYENVDLCFGYSLSGCGAEIKSVGEDALPPVLCFKRMTGRDRREERETERGGQRRRGQCSRLEAYHLLLTIAS